MEAQNTDAPAAEEAPAIPLDSIPGNVVISFDFTNEKLVPPGIPKMTRASNREVDNEHAAKAIQSGKAELIHNDPGRAGRKCTGEPFLQNVHYMSVALIRRSLAKMSSTSLSGGRCSNASAAFGFLTSKLTETRLPASSSLMTSLAGTFHAWSFSFRFFHHAKQSANSSNWIGFVFE